MIRAVMEFSQNVTYSKHTTRAALILPELAIQEKFADDFALGLVADMSEEDIVKVKSLMLDYIKDRHPQEPLRLVGKGYVGYGTR